MAVLGQPHQVHTTQELASPSHAHPTRGLPTRAMAHCTLISRPIQKHGDRLGGQACCKQHASPTRLWGRSPPTHPRPPLFAVPTDPPPGTTWDTMVHPVGTHPRNSYLILRSTFCSPEGRVCAVCQPSPHCGVGCGASGAGPVSMVVFESFDRGQRTALTPPPQPKRYPGCRK